VPATPAHHLRFPNLVRQNRLAAAASKRSLFAGVNVTVAVDFSAVRLR
jgi:tRNA splicing endonuclease